MRRGRSAAGRSRRSPRGSRPRGPCPRARARPGRARPRSQDARSRPASPVVRARRGSTASSRSRGIGKLDHAVAGGLVGARPRGTARSGAARGAAGAPATKHALLGVVALLDRRAERVERRERAALVVGNEQPDVARSGRRTAAATALLQLVEPLAGRAPRPRSRRESGSRAGAARAGRPGRSCSARARSGARPPPISSSTASTAATCSRSRSSGSGRVGDVQHEVGDERLLERGREALDQLRAAAGG